MRLPRTRTGVSTSRTGMSSFVIALQEVRTLALETGTPQLARRLAIAWRHLWPMWERPNLIQAVEPPAASLRTPDPAGPGFHQASHTPGTESAIFSPFGHTRDR
jgi:hypothetical protein